MPVRIEQRVDTTPRRLHNHFEVTDDAGRNVGLTVAHLEQSIQETIGYLDMDKYLVVAEAHQGVSLLRATGIILKRELIRTFTNHPNLLGIVVFQHQDTLLSLLIESARRINPMLHVPMFTSRIDFQDYIENFSSPQTPSDTPDHQGSR